MPKRRDAPILTKQQGREFLASWRRVNALEIEELRSRTPDEDVDAFCIVMETAEALGFANEGSDEKEDNEVRERWARLRRVYLGEEKRS